MKHSLTDCIIMCVGNMGGRGEGGEDENEAEDETEERKRKRREGGRK